MSKGGYLWRVSGSEGGASRGEVTCGEAESGLEVSVKGGRIRS